MRKNALKASWKGKRPACLFLAGLMLFLSFGGQALPVLAEEAVEQPPVVSEEATEPTTAETGAPVADTETTAPDTTVSDATEAASEPEVVETETAETETSTEEDVFTMFSFGTFSESMEEDVVAPILRTSAVRRTSFESTLSAFPESYRPYLEQLHAAHPNWTFTPEYLNIDWDTAVMNESDYGVSLTAASSPASWKGTMDSVFNAENNTWTGLDGSSWVQASVAVTEYFMDPRTYLNDQSVFAFLDHSYNESMAGTYEASLRQMLANTAMSGNLQDNNAHNYVAVLMDAGRAYGVNPMVLAAMIMIEQGSDLHGGCVSGTVRGYEGYYNYVNIGAYARSGMSAVERGLWYASGQGSGQNSYRRPWNSRYESIMGGAMYYAQNYVAQGQDTLYYKRFNVGPSTAESQRFRHQYMTNIQGCASESQKLARAYAGQDLALNFVIPVYDNMPGSAVPRPTSNTIGSGDVSVSGRVVRTNSRFDPNATPVPIANPTATLNTSYGVSDGYIRGVTAGTTVSGLVSALGVQNGTVTVYNSLGSVITGDRQLGTGYTVYLYNNAGEVQEGDYIVVTGDLNGDGRITAVDLLRVQKGLLGVTVMSGAVYQAGDINGDGQVSALDLLKVQKHLLGVSRIG